MSTKFNLIRVKLLEITAFKKKTPEKNSQHGRFSANRRLLKQNNVAALGLDADCRDLL